MTRPVLHFAAERATVEIFRSSAEVGRAAAHRAGELVHEALARRDTARIVVGTGPSQRTTIASLVALAEIDWNRIEVFHMDEYVGIPNTHPASFRRWLREHLADLVHPGRVHYLVGDAFDVEAECRRYTGLLEKAPIDIAFVGFGENGHIAFNDPGNADFDDPLLVKRVVLDRRCRMQQVGEGHFPDIDSVPREAITLTCPAVMSAAHLICAVPDLRKAEAVRNAVEGPVSNQCPASLVRTHPSARIYLDVESASHLSEGAR